MGLTPQGAPGLPGWRWSRLALPVYLGLGEVQLAGQLSALTAHHVLAALELHLQAVELLGGEGRACPLGPIQVQAFGEDDLSDGPLGIWGRGESLSLNLLGRPEGAGQDIRLILPQGSVSELGRFPVVPLTQPQRSEEGMSETGCWSCPRFTWRLRAVDRK